MVRLKKLHNLFFGLILFVLLLTPYSIKAQLTTSTALTPTQLVQTVLLGSGVTATNITYNGAPLSIGEFSGTSNLGLTGGVIMASGDVDNAEGPNNTSGSSTGNGLSGDSDLDIIMSPTLSEDATILEFDFIPTSDTVKFRYVFGSEEYMEYVSTTPGGINDGFGFFISGPGISGPFSNNAKNIALIPGTTLPVTMFNLNLNNNGTYYFDNGDGFGGGTAPDGQSVQYDGFTVPLTAIAGVQCGQTYHIKLAIADGGDDILDSGVFLEAGSFASSGGTTISTGTNFGGAIVGNDSTIYEGCGFASLIIDRGAGNTATAQSFYFTLTGSATENADFTPVGDSIHFAVGQDTSSVIIASLPDVLIEGTETVLLTLYVTPAPNASPCGGIYDTLYKTIYIIDTPPLKVSLNDDTSLVCPSQNLFLTAQTAGGVAIGGYSYTWSNASGTSDTLHINPQGTTTYIVTVMDSCGNTASDTTTVNFIPYVPMQLTMNNDTVICGGNEVLLDANITGGLPIYNYAWSPNVTSQDSVTVYPPTSARYILTVTDACGYNLSDTVDITVYPINTDFDYTFSTNQTVAFNNLSTGTISHLWNFGDGSDDSVSTETSPQHYYVNEGTYTVTLISVNQNGCSDTSIQSIVIIPDFYFYFPNAFTPYKNDKNDFFMGYGSGIKTYRMRIFDRWGQMVFESNDILTGWDGTYKGAPSEAAVYVCVFDLVSLRGKKIRRIGNATLLR
ncbi:MAG: choice-of-anchor L domain-containing protein [Bacteroidota bacterium]